MTISEHLEQAIDYSDRGLYQLAFVSTCAAITETLKKKTGNEQLSENDYLNFIGAHPELFSFMCLPRAYPLALNVPFGVKRIEPMFNVHHGVEEIVLLLIQKTIALGRLPEEFAFQSSGAFEIKDGKLLIPHTLVGGLLGLTVVDPVNKDETGGENCWINISDFKMFVSELWGRIDLAERVRNFYLESD